MSAIAAMILVSLLAACSSGGPSPVAPNSPSASATPSESGHPTTPSSKRANIIFVLTDDLSTDLLPVMPQVRALQQAGSSFTNNFVVDSLCCPSRTAIFTGEYPHDNGVFTNNPPDGGYAAYNKHRNAPNSFAVALHKSGYRTGFYGKYLNGYRPQFPQPRGWDQWHVAGNGYAEYDYQLRENDKITGHGHRPTDYLTDVLGREASGFVTSAAKLQKPFMLEVATFAPHEPATPAEQDKTKFASLKKPRTAAFNRRSQDAPKWEQTVPGLTRQQVTTMDQRYRKRAQSVQAVDRMVGQLRQQLVRLGIADNTYFVFSSDNGYHIGEHQLLPGKQTAFDTDIKVPLIVAGPHVPAGRTVDAMTASIDLCPTFEEIAGLKPGPKVDGISMLPLWHGREPKDWQQAVLIEHHNSGADPSSDPDYQANRHGNPPSYEAVRTRDALYVAYADGEREYYDLRTDPAELHNLAWKLSPARLAPIKKKLAALQNCHNAAACQRAARS